MILSKNFCFRCQKKKKRCNKLVKNTIKCVMWLVKKKKIEQIHAELSQITYINF